MSVFLRGNTWYMKFAVNGIAVYESTHTSTRRDAERIEAKRRAELVNQVVLAGEVPVKLHRALNEFLNSRSNYASHKNCVNRLAPYFEITDKDLHKVTDAELINVTESMFAAGLAKSTVGVSVNYWNAFIKYCKKKKYSTCDTMSTIKGVKGKIRFLTEAEQADLFAAIDPNTDYPGKNYVTDAQKQDNLDLCWVLLHTGARFAEIANMSWGQVDFDEGTIYIKRSKGGRDSTVHMTKKLREVLTARRKIEPGDDVFGSKKGRHNETHWVKAAVERAKLSTANGSITLHTLRHTAAIRWLKSGLSLPEVQQMLGHASIKSTMVYLNFVPTEVAKRAAAMIDAAHVESVPAPKPLRLVV